jgi:hypothetical protein
MHETLLMPMEWARAEFATADLGDKRRTTRLVKLAAALAANPSAGTLPSALPQWSDLKAAYRLLGSDAIDHAAVVAPHVRRVREDCLSGGGGGGGERGDALFGREAAHVEGGDSTLAV